MEILRVPKLNENMDAAMVGPWSKAVGEAVAPGDVIVDLVTDKAAFELEAEEEGVLRMAAASEKSTVPVGYALAVVAGVDETLPDIDAENAALMESYTSALEIDAAAPSRSRSRATPAARRLARENDVDISEVASALGGDGVVDRSAVEKFLKERT